MARRVIRPDTVIRQIARDWPETRPVLERYGVRASTPPFGPLLTLESFARRQGIDLSRLLAELASAAGASVDTSRNVVHRPFIALALAYGILIGGGLGAWMAWDAARHGGYEFVPTRHAMAHGLIQQWGFLVCFITGIAFRWLPMGTGCEAVRAWRGQLMLGLVGVGSLCVFTWCHAEGWFPSLGPIGATSLLIASVLIAAEFVRLTRLARERHVWSLAIFAGVFWLCVAALLLTRSVFNVSKVGPDSLDPYMRLILSDLPIAGFVVNCIYGFGLRILPPFVGAPVRTGVAALSVGVHNVGVLVLLIGRLRRWPSTTSAVAALLLLAALLYVVAMPRLRRPRLPSDRPEQGPRVSAHIIASAFLWAVVGWALYAAAGITELLQPSPTPAAIRIYGPTLAPLPLYDGGRHAVTLGFITGLIIGVGSRLIPMLEHRILQHARLILPAFVCLELGVALRVGGDVGALFWPRIWKVQVVAAALVLAGMALFALAALRTLWPAPDPLVRYGRVSQLTPVVLLLEHYPEAYDWLVQRGVRYLARVRSVPPELTLGSMLSSEGLDVEETLRELQTFLSNRPATAART